MINDKYIYIEESLIYFSQSTSKLMNQLLVVYLFSPAEAKNKPPNHKNCKDNTQKFNILKAHFRVNNVRLLVDNG